VILALLDDDALTGAGGAGGMSERALEARDLSSPHRMSRVGPDPISVFIDGAHIRAVPG
jgi:hypothetical protein